MKKSFIRLGVQWLFVLLLLANLSARRVYAQSASDANFLAAVGELRDATFADTAGAASFAARVGA